MKPAYYRKLPVVIEAMQSTGTPESNRAIIDWTRGSTTPACMDSNGDGAQQLSIVTLEGAMWVMPGDWIIKGVKGEFYPCKPDIFNASYEQTDDDDADEHQTLPAGWNKIGEVQARPNRRPEPVIVTDPGSGIQIQLPRTLTRRERRALAKIEFAEASDPTRRERRAINKAGRSLDRRTSRT